MNIFPPTNLQITSLYASSPASNVTPAELTCNIAIRFSPEITSEQIKTEVQKIAKATIFCISPLTGKYQQSHL